MSGRLFHVLGDWYEWRQEPGLSASVQVRVVAGGDGRLGIAELRLCGEVTSELLRSVPLGRIEAAANAQVVDLTPALPPGGEQRHRRQARGRARTVEDGWDVSATPPHNRPMPKRLPATLRDTAGGGRTDEFYATVASVYRELARTSARPAVELADANEVPVTTAHRWIKEARRRGFLGPGRPGKAG